MMIIRLLSTAVLTAALAFAKSIDAQADDSHGLVENGWPFRITPKVFIVSMIMSVLTQIQFTPEAEVWHGIPEFNLLAHNITVPGFSPEFPDAHCTADYSICQVVTGEGEINAAATLTALAFSPIFNLRKTYFLIAGIVGVDPKTATIAAATFARYEVQVALQYEFDIRDLPSNFTTGYIPQGAYAPDEYPRSIYGTEVFELNADLRERAMDLVRAANVTLADNDASRNYRAKYAAAANANGSSKYAAAVQPPSLIACDGVTSDTYFSGTHLSDAFSNYTRLVTNGTGVFCATGQEDSATFEALVRGAAAKRVDFSRIIALRTGSDFTLPPPGVSDFQNLEFRPSETFDAAVTNIKLAGLPIVQGIVRQWNSTFERGVRPSNYIGDILGTLNDGKPRDFGPPVAIGMRDVSGGGGGGGGGDGGKKGVEAEAEAEAGRYHRSSSVAMTTTTTGMRTFKGMMAERRRSAVRGALMPVMNIAP